MISWMGIRVARTSPVLASHVFNGFVFLASLGMFVYGLVFTGKPGPSEYYSHMAGVYLSSLLLFQTLQFVGIKNSRSLYGPWAYKLAHAYYIILLLAGLVVGIGYALTPKPDCTTIGFLTFADAMAALIYLRYFMRTRFESKPGGLSPGITDIEQPCQPKRKHERRWKRCMGVTWRGFNRFLKLAHLIFIILAASGAVQLALTYRFPNPGKIIAIDFPAGSSLALNYNCTTVPSGSNGSAPTIWLEADMAHGIVDFQGLQHYLAVSHGRNSCAYDPPNFGWSQRLPSSQADYYSSFRPLLTALGRQDEDMVLVGWGAGAENVVRHAAELPENTKAVVLMDSSPDGIEWLYTAAAQNMTRDQMLKFRSSDLNSRIGLLQVILGLGVPWGLMAVLNPGNSTGFFDQSAYPRFRAQSQKEDFWAYQYYGLLAMAAMPTPDTYLTTTVLPAQIPVYAMMTRNTNGTDSFESTFYRTKKVAMAENIGGGRLAGTVGWCEAAGCSLSFPVNMPEWTADALIELGI